MTDNTNRSAAAIRSDVSAWTHDARMASANIRSAYEKAEEQAAEIAAHPELRMDAKAARQAGVRATVALQALDQLPKVHASLHKGLAAAERRAMPTPPSDAGLAIRQRAELDQFFALEQGKQGELLRTDQAMREALFGSGTRFDHERAKSIPTIDYEAIRRQTMVEYAPMLMASIDEHRQEARAALRTLGRAVGAGMTGERVELAGLMPEGSKRAGDVARRIENLPADWSADADPVYITDRKQLEQRMEAGAGRMSIR